MSYLSSMSRHLCSCAFLSTVHTRTGLLCPRSVCFRPNAVSLYSQSARRSNNLQIFVRFAHHLAPLSLKGIWDIEGHSTTL